MNRKAVPPTTGVPGSAVRTLKVKLRYMSSRSTAENPERPGFSSLQRALVPHSRNSHYLRPLPGVKDYVKRLAALLDRIRCRSLKAEAMARLLLARRKDKAVRSLYKVNFAIQLKHWKTKGRALVLQGHLRGVELQLIRRWVWDIMKTTQESVALTTMICRCEPAEVLSCVSAAIRLLKALPEYWTLLERRVGAVTPTSVLSLFPSSPHSCFEAICSLFPVLEDRPKPKSLRSEERILSTCQTCGLVSRASLWPKWRELGSVPLWNEEAGVIVYSDQDFYSEELSCQAANMTQEAYISALQSYFPNQMTDLPVTSEPPSIEDCLRYHSRVRRDKELFCPQCNSIQFHLVQYVLTPPPFLLLYIPSGLQLALHEEVNWQNRRYSLRVAVQANTHYEVMQWPQWRSGLLNPHCLLFQQVS